MAAAPCCLLPVGLLPGCCIEPTSCTPTHGRCVETTCFIQTRSRCIHCGHLYIVSRPATTQLPRVILQVVEPFGDNRPFSPMLQRAPGQRPSPAPQVQVSEEALEQLLAMGFDRTNASAALVQTGNNVQAALSILL